MRPVTVVLIGAGERGLLAYAPFAREHPDEMKIVAVCEPDPIKRARCQERYGLPDEACFVDYQHFFQAPVKADCALVCTQDQMHTEPAMQAMQMGYHVLLEKPMAVTEADCRLLADTARQTGRVLMVCHVLRYTPFYTALKALLDAGTLGELMSVQHCEGIATWHFAHSFVRGNWSVEAKSAPMILAKCCHDLDLLHWLVGDRCTQVYSVGQLGYFNAAHAPKGTPARCLDGCPHARTCLYYAPDQYLGTSTEWPVSAISPDTSLAARHDALLHGPYGRCVFHCDNDVCDHQVVELSMAGGMTVQMTATAFSTTIDRHTRMMGTKAELDADFAGEHIRVRYHGSGRVEDIRLHTGADNLGHGGGDFKLLRDFLDVVRDGQGEAKTMAEDSLASHLMAFAAERSRHSGEAVPFAR